MPIFEPETSEVEAASYSALNKVDFNWNNDLQLERA